MPSHHPKPASIPAASNHVATPDRLAADLLDQAYSQQPTALFTSAFLAVMMAIVLRNQVSPPLLLSWLLVNLLVSGLRYILCRQYHKRRVAEDEKPWRQFFLAGLLLAGLVWGSAGIILFAEDSTTHQIFLAFVLGGLVAGSTTSLAALPMPLRLFILLLLAPIALNFFLADGEIAMTMGSMLVLYGIMYAVMASRIHQFLRSTFTLRLENREEIESRRKAEENLNQYQSNLERLVLERTRALSRSNEELFQEILERKKAEEEKSRIVSHLLHTQKMEAIGTLAGGIAHDFNNILSIILGFTELAIDELPENSRLKSDLKEVFTAAQRGKNLVRQILQFSRNDRQNPIPLNPRKLISDLQTMLRATIPASVEFRTDLNHECGPILADPNQMHRILTNLATNAAHAMEDKGVLTFTLEQVELAQTDLAPHEDLPPGPYARISVSDTGPGIDPALKARIFEPFFTTKEVDKGTGMGLAVVHGIVSSNKGMITVESVPGQGTTFHLFFPITSQVVSSTAAIKTDLPSGRERILVVDDDQAIATMTSRLLTRQGYKVTTSGGGAPALQQLRATPNSFDLVITDQTMPDLTGLELAEELRKIRADLPVVLCTGYSSKISPETIARAGIKEVLMKPVTREELSRRIRAVLDASRAPAPG